VDADYETYAGFLELAAQRARAFAGRSFEIPVLALFCTALRRDVLDAVGPLDEGFGVGMFEDDDYAARLRAQGFSLRCAEDVFVHHVGEAPFGDLVPGGEHAEPFASNRRRFEEKWGTTWRSHGRREGGAYSAMVSRLRALVAAHVPEGATVLVVSRGDDALLDLGRRSAHFPQSPAGGWAGHHPGTSEEAIAHLEALRAAGASYLLLPATGTWWLSHYTGLADHLRHAAVTVAGGDDGVLFRLGGRADATPTAELARAQA
jgi:hypothetical protein